MRGPDDAAGLRQAAKRLLPEGSPRRRAFSASRETVRELRDVSDRLRTVWARQGYPNRALGVSYRRWLKSHRAGPADLRHQARDWREAHDPIQIVCVIGDRGDAAALASTLRSIAEQTWGSWNAIVLSPPASGVETRHRSEPELRVRTVLVPGDEVWSGTDDAVGSVDPRSLLVFLDAGDRLEPDCLFHVAGAAHRDPAVDLVHWDDDATALEGSDPEPRFRPEWSPEMLLSANYLGRSFAIRASRYRDAGGVRAEMSSARLWDLLLRSGLDTPDVCRVPRVLGHLVGRDEDVTDQGLRAVAEYLDALGLSASAERAPGGVRVRWNLQHPPPATIVIPTKHNRPLIGPCLESLRTTDYHAFDVVVVDNGARTPENEAWYEQFVDLDLTVLWWSEAFNYSAVNNLGAAKATGEVLVFLNDDTEVLDPSWLTEMVGWVRRPEIGVVGLQLLDRDGNLQHGGAILGMGGFADHIFQGLAPLSQTMLGPTTWYRDVLAITGACLAIRRELFEEIGGMDERFILCGSDVALGLDAHLRGKRNVCSPFAALRHLESVTRGTDIPRQDFFASYWRYQHWIFGGDPYFSPNLSLGSRTPRLRSPHDPAPGTRLTAALGRSFEVFRQRSDQGEAFMLADTCRATPPDVEAIATLHRVNSEPFPVRTLDWFLPDIDSPFYGGVNTAFRIADQLARDHGVENRFVVIGGGPEPFFRSALAAAFPALAACPAVICDGTAASVASLPPADAAIATLWTTAYAVAHLQNVRRKFYLIQDFEPMFYPAGSLYALAEESYRLGLYGVTNTANLLRIYEDDYHGRGTSFTPAVDPSVFHPYGRRDPDPDSPVTVFVYARPGHWRNCWELAGPALGELKDRLGDGVRIVTAGSWAVPDSPGLPAMRHLGLLDYRATGDLYRTCDVGLSLTVSKHPSYLPLELMACGVPVVAFDNPWGHWILRDGENSLLAMRTVGGLTEALERMVVDADLRRRLAANARVDIDRAHSSWDVALGGIYDYLCHPDGASAATP